jgi:hypothetical protein
MLQDMIRAVADAAGISALLAFVFVDRPDGKKFGIPARAFLGLSYFGVAFLIFMMVYLWERNEHNNRITSLERDIAVLIAGNPMSFEQIVQIFPKRDVDEIEEALENMENEQSIQISLQDALIVGGPSNIRVLVRMYVVSR